MVIRLDEKGLLMRQESVAKDPLPPIFKDHPEVTEMPDIHN